MNEKELREKLKARAEVLAIAKDDAATWAERAAETEADALSAKAIARAAADVAEAAASAHAEAWAELRSHMAWTKERKSLRFDSH